MAEIENTKIWTSIDTFGEIQKVSLRDVWPNEAHNFTPWLADNIESLGNTLGFDLELIEREASVGGFSLDLLAKDLSSQENVIIENQLNQTDHDHLGKIITYASGFNASTVIWIAESIRDEHRQALDWLNQRTNTETKFFGVVVEVLKIDDSRPAFIFKPIITPNEWQKSKARVSSKTTTSSKGEEYRHYFQPLIDELREKHKFTNVRKAQPQNWHEFSSGFPGIHYSTAFGMGSIPRVEVYIDQNDKETNELLFDSLEKHKNAIHDSFQESLEWLRLDEKRACVIRHKRDGSARLSEMSEEEIVKLRQWHISYVLRIKSVFDPVIKKELSA